jgi:hypothetical protein
MTQAATHCQVPRAWQPTKQERLRTMLLEMPLTRAELVERTGWAAKQVDKAIEDAMRQGSVILEPAGAHPPQICRAGVCA